MAEKLEYTRNWTNEADFPHLSFTKNWENPEDYPTYEPDEVQVRKDMQSLHDEVKDYINDTLIPEILAADATEAARTDAENQRVSNEEQRIANENARIEAENARADENTGIVAQATEQAESAAESARLAQQAVLGQIPDGSISKEKLSEDLQATIDRAVPNVSSQVSLYVSKSGNDDTGDGTRGNPYLTIQKAVDSAPRVHCDLLIYIGPGTYDESVFVYALSNIGIRAQDSANKPTVKSFRLAQCANGTLMNIVVNGVYNETYRAAIYVEQVAKMYMEGVVCTENDKSQSAYGGGIRFNGGIGRLTKCEISNKYTALSAVGSVVFLDKNCTGANNTNALVSGDGYGNTPAAIFKGTSTISGAEVMGFGGKIW